MMELQIIFVMYTCSLALSFLQAVFHEVLQHLRAILSQLYSSLFFSETFLSCKEILVDTLGISWNPRHAWHGCISSDFKGHIVHLEQHVEPFMYHWIFHGWYPATEIDPTNAWFVSVIFIPWFCSLSRLWTIGMLPLFQANHYDYLYAMFWVKQI